MTLTAGSPSSARHPARPGGAGTPPPGWYPDPTGHARLRHWNGRAWSEWVSDGVTVRHDPGALHRKLEAADLPHLEFVERVFLPDALAAGFVTPQEEAQLEHLVDTLRAQATAGRAAPLTTAPAITWAGEAPVPLPAPTTAPPTTLAPPTTPTTPGARTSSTPVTHPAPTPTATPRPPSAAAVWWARTREAVGSDLAVHGLAYVGVLLLLVGAFGLVVFAFADVEVTLRPVAELAIALAPFGAAALLLHRGATVVGRALEVAGGLLVPVMVITGFLDDSTFPPDLYGVELAVTLTVLTALLAIAYAGWSWRHPRSALRYLVAPVAWLSVGMATLGLGERDVPDGKAVATPGAAQCAAIMAVLVVTVALARWRPANLLSRPTRVAALPGLAVIGAMSLGSWVAEGWPFGPVLVTGVLALVALELLADSLPPTVVATVEPLWWCLVWAGLAMGAADLPVVVSAGSVAALVALGFAGVLERAAAVGRSWPALLLASLGLVAALLATLTDASAATVAFSVASVWAAGRRMAPFAVRGAALGLDLATAVLPALTLACLAAATSAPLALATGGAVVLLMTVPANWSVRREGRDHYWTTWWLGAGLAVVAMTTAASVQPEGWSRQETWLLVAGFGFLTAAAAIGPLTAVQRPPVVTGLAAATWVSGAWLLDATPLTLTAPLALVGLALVAAAHIATPLTTPGPERTGPVDPASLGLTGHALGLVAITLAVTPGWAPVVTVAMATAGFGTTGWLDAVRTSPVGSALTRLRPVGPWIPLSVTAVGIPVTMVLTLDRAGAIPVDDERSVFAVVATAVAYATLSRLALPDRVVSVAGWSGFLAAVVATVAADSRIGVLAGLAAVSVTTALVRTDRRPRLMTWVSWAVVAPFVGLLTAETWEWFDAQPDERAVAFTLATTGAVLLVGAAAADLRGRPWTPRLLPTHRWALPPAAVGAADVLAGVLVAAAVLPADTSGWVVAIAATALLATAVLSRVGARAGVAVVLGWAALLLLRGNDIQARPWVAVTLALGLIVMAQLLSTVSHEVSWWARWDAPLLVSATPVAATALVVSVGTSSAATTFVAVGAECLAVAGWLRRHPAVSVPVGLTGTVLVLLGAGIAGTGWLALAMLGLSVGLTALAVVASGWARTALQVGGALAAAGAWWLAGDWLGLTDQRTVDVTALSAALVVLVLAWAAALTRLERSWVLVWGGTALVADALCAVDVTVPSAEWLGWTEPSWPIATGLLVVAVSLLAAPQRLRLAWLPDLGAGYGLGALLVGMQAAEISVGRQVLVLCVVTVAAALGALLVPRRSLPPRWSRPVVEAGVVTSLWAIGLALFGNGDPMLLVPALAAAAVQAAGTGVALGRTLVQMASPALACAAWVVFSVEALDGNPQWVTVPIGLATLVVVALWRHDCRERGAPVASPQIVVLELVGIAFLVGAALVQAVTESVAYAVLATAIGLSVAAWGVVSQVRRRLAAGVGIVLVGVVLLIGVPLWNLLLPAWDAAVVWVLIGLAGLIALVVAGLLDWGRAAARRELTRIEESTAGWE